MNKYIKAHYFLLPVRAFVSASPHVSEFLELAVYLFAVSDVVASTTNENRPNSSSANIRVQIHGLSQWS